MVNMARPALDVIQGLRRRGLKEDAAGAVAVDGGWGGRFGDCTLAAIITILPWGAPD